MSGGVMGKAGGGNGTPVIAPGATIGVLGGGQLGRMMALAGSNLGYRFVAMDPTPDAPCGQVAGQIVARYDDQAAARELAARADVITYEFENVDAGVAALLEEASYVPQGSRLLYTTQHRLREKRAIEAAGVKVAPYAEIGSEEELRAAVARLGLPAVLKTATGGYDGKGQWVIRGEDEIAPAYAELSKAGTELVLEQFVPFVKELSVIAARSPRGEIKTFPAAENIHVDNILHVSIVPARVEEQVQREAERLAARIAEGLEAVGLLAVEMFLTEDGELFVNELAPRPHNSGHYTMEACTTSQFEQHVRAICNLPLGPVELLTPVVMVNILGEHLEAVRKAVVTGQWFGEAGGETGFPVIPKVHLYGKHGAAPKRKMGHINLICRNVEDGLRWIEQTNIWRNECK
ncbi:5-(carboxyamino)imidazole ribonucleotide synthase [Paenibacillus phoenicis]|uniref:N5-carboxyaminoimidazole ribonucleotide synthase n=1 Tax=Paenibacillus phoenicis TaxID=554117 RepID=A0ABU5PRF0_9BACL|nr:MULTISPECIES: 5-(carboxyamino)imidazole ribonucleotide synthase [Paenibacillus]EES73506.1 phosphoribosylaminoimidazole carboxylase, ATPase subunit [Paenibacillus sp. oral taxon 786 str. D14]MCT2195270.1 5-(carboxyamino)imidazole ribonucleotide synthase [Paenibacillus sp. p3-SID1389]MEA3572519.1 5-(carboxyamino)imidazole ribonucleotide synthase [Paenibacillus phoenicis]